jgi:plasmid stabilization system protein ParE
MTYTVTWTPSAQQELADLWVHAPDRAAVTAAANTIDALLRRDPQNAGESRSGPTRLLFEPPLFVLFDVSEDDRLVNVWGVWRTN